MLDQLGLLSDPVDGWKRVALANALKPPVNSDRDAHSPMGSVGLGCALAFEAVGLGITARWLPTLSPLIILALLWSGRAALERIRERRDAHAQVDEALDGAEAFLEAGEHRLAAALSAQALCVAVSARGRQGLFRAHAWAAIAARNPFAAHDALSRLSPQSVDVHLVAAYLDCCNRTNEAVALLEEARADGVRSARTSKLLVDLYYRQGKRHAARHLLASDHLLLTQRDRDAIERALQ